jgi:hypothetical protein
MYLQTNITQFHQSVVPSTYRFCVFSTTVKLSCGNCVLGSYCRFLSCVDFLSLPVKYTGAELLVHGVPLELFTLGKGC